MRLSPRQEAPVMNSQNAELRHTSSTLNSPNLLTEDPFELAIEEASSRFVQSLRTFHVEKAHVLQSTLFRQQQQLKDGKVKASPGVQCRQCPSSRFAATSLKFSPVIREDDDGKNNVVYPSAGQLVSHPLALLSYIPKDAALFIAGAIAGAVARTTTAPLDRIKLLMQVHSVKTAQESARTSIGFLEAAVKIGKEEGLQGFWKGNLPQVLRLVPYSAIQLTSYELYKKLFKGEDKELSVIGRLAAGACAGMTSTLATYPLDVLRLRLAVDPSCKSMVQVATIMLRDEGLSSFYGGLGPSLLGIAPYIALNFCAFDLIKNSLPEEIRKTPAASFLTALFSSSLATTSCYPLDTIRRQMQIKGTPYRTVLDAFSGILAKDGIIGLYRGFVPNALKSLPNSSIRLTTFDTAKNIYNASEREFQRLAREREQELVREREQGPKSFKL